MTHLKLQKSQMVILLNGTLGDVLVGNVTFCEFCSVIFSNIHLLREKVKVKVLLSGRCIRLTEVDFEAGYGGGEAASDLWAWLQHYESVAVTARQSGYRQHNCCLCHC